MMAWEMNPKSSLNAHSSNTSWNPPLTSKPPPSRRRGSKREVTEAVCESRSLVRSSPPSQINTHQHAALAAAWLHCKFQPRPSHTTLHQSPSGSEQHYISLSLLLRVNPNGLQKQNPTLNQKIQKNRKETIQNPTNCLKNDLKCLMAGCS